MGWVRAALGLAPRPASDRAWIPFEDLGLTQLDGSPLPARILRGNVVLFVNVASRCGYTPQYAGLQRLYEQKKDRGLVIVGVPCNQFGAQEPGGAEQISEFCEGSYGVTFPLLEKQHVNGARRSLLFRHLIGDGSDVSWNFEKVLVCRTGQVVARFASKVKPNAPELVDAIDAALEGPG